MGYLYFWQCLFIYSFAYLLFCVIGIYSVGGNETDQQALLEFKAGIAADPLGVMSSWNDTTDFCQWYGVVCGRRHRRVTILDLGSSKLSGTISPYIGNLSFLEVLRLANNSLTDHIPLEIGRLQRLQKLYLLNNSLTGEIPTNISSCSNLIILSLANNKLMGEVPMQLGYLEKLQYLSITENNLTGTFPYSLGNLSSLIGFYAAYNNFAGNIPDSFGQLKNLSYLGLAKNYLSGTIPSSIFNLSSLIQIEIIFNHFKGSLPADLFTSLTNLQYLNFGRNNFTGFIPYSLSNASNLVVLQLQGNHFTGTVPSFERLNIRWVIIAENNLGNEVDDLGFFCSLTNSSILQELFINQNNFSGFLPECIGNLSSKLELFALSNNQISGSIPTSIGNLVNLQLIAVDNNLLSGMIPQSIGNLRNVVMLYLNNNKFFGRIPSSLGNLTKLNELHFNDNNLQGTVPSSLANCKNLLLLDFSRNNLSGTIPPQVIGLSSLSIYVGFAHNLFNGSLPAVGNLKNLLTLDISNNMFSGEIPTSLGSCTSLENLYLNMNYFHGSIPSSLRSLRSLQVLDFSHNNLSGQIPGFFSRFDSLRELNLSFNDFEGIVPVDGIFNNASITSVMGNNKLCGGMPMFQLPVCQFKISHGWRFKVIIATVAGIFGTILVLFSLLLFWFKKKRKNPTNPETSLPNLLRVSYNDLHNATNGFDSANLIGSGSFGSVYRGILNGGQQTVAVKVLNLQYGGAAKSFIAECEALKNIRHRNLLKIITSCSSVDYKGNDFKALVYEFMANGNLEEWLHPTVEMNLNLTQRLNIAIDIASAIDYLHHNSGTPLVHCDLKPSNVLLDDEMTAHIGDFGLAKFLLHNILNNSSIHSSSIGLRGTIGYAPPEYGVGSEVSTSGDVYSYGILLLEMFTGKRPTDEMFNEGNNLHRFIKSALQRGVNPIVDPIILQEDGQSDDRIMMECVISVLEIGISCSLESRSDRMDISEAAVKLNLIRDSYQSTPHQRRNEQLSNTRIDSS